MILKKRVNTLQPSDSRILTVGIVGGGPRGFYACESLVRHWRQQTDAPSLRIVIFEPSGHVGAGNIYHPDNGTHLRMNFANRHINIFETNDARHHHLTLMQWFKTQRNQQLDDDGVVSRRVVGEYLRDGFAKLTDDLPDHVDVVVDAQRVDDVMPTSDGWRIVSPSSQILVDQLVITTGHQGWREPTGIPNAGIGGIYPTHDRLSLQRVPPGSNVDVCGFGLTFIDAALSLTEARGGKFDINDSGDFRYRNAADEVASIRPRSRTGRPMLPKPLESIVAKDVDLRSVWDRFDKRLAIFADQASLGQRIDFEVDALPLILQAADLAIERANACTGVRSESCRDAFERWCDWQPEQDEVAALWRHSYLVATGKRPVDWTWAIGAAWRRLYRPICGIARGYSNCGGLGCGGLGLHQWRRFQKIAAEMERLSFGPPAENIGRMLALHRAGILHLDDFRSSDTKAPSERIQIDARIPGPLDHDPDSIIAKLLQRRRIVADPIRGAIRTDAAGRALDENDQPSENLAIFGRCTEGWNIGSDSLSRQQSRDIESWGITMTNSAGSDARFASEFVDDQAHKIERPSVAI